MKTRTGIMGSVPPNKLKRYSKPRAGLVNLSVEYTFEEIAV
jgi:hypothetical protein